MSHRPQHSPRLSILTAVRDGLGYLDAAIESIRCQSLTDWEWILVDDGSSDGTAERLDLWASRDPRLRVTHRPARGLVAALNDGLEQCTATGVARMDADDVARPERLAALVTTLDASDATVVDSRVELIGGSRNQGMHDYVAWVNDHTDHDSIAADLFVESPIVHPAAAFRRQPVADAGGYRSGDFPEDYDLWLRLYRAGARFTKLQETLLDWRDHGARATRTDPRYRTTAFTALKQQHLWDHEHQALAEPGLVLWGAARATRSWRQWLHAHDVKPVFVIDQNPKRLGNRILGAPVLDPSALGKRDWRYLLVTVSSPTSRATIRAILGEMAIPLAGDRRIRFV